MKRPLREIQETVAAALLSFESPEISAIVKAGGEAERQQRLDIYRNNIRAAL